MQGMALSCMVLYSPVQFIVVIIYPHQSTVSTAADVRIFDKMFFVCYFRRHGTTGFSSGICIHKRGIFLHDTIIAAATKACVQYMWDLNSKSCSQTSSLFAQFQVLAGKMGIYFEQLLVYKFHLRGYNGFVQCPLYEMYPFCLIPNLELGVISNSRGCPNSRFPLHLCLQNNPGILKLTQTFEGPNIENPLEDCEYPRSSSGDFKTDGTEYDV